MANVMVPAGRTMVSAAAPAAQSGHVAASLFALMRASRMEQLPSVARISLVVVTVIVFASAGAGNAKAAANAAMATRPRTRRPRDDSEPTRADFNEIDRVYP